MQCFPAPACIYRPLFSTPRVPKMAFSSTTCALKRSFAHGKYYTYPNQGLKHLRECSAATVLICNACHPQLHQNHSRKVKKLDFEVEPIEIPTYYREISGEVTRTVFLFNLKKGLWRTAREKCGYSKSELKAYCGVSEARAEQYDQDKRTGANTKARQKSRATLKR